MIRWKGPYGDTDIPAGQRFEGWSEYTTGAGTFKNRYRDGDSLGAHHWRELAANVNRHIAMSQQPLWQTGLIGTGVSSTDGARICTAPSFAEVASWQACMVRVRLQQSPRRGVSAPPRLLCRVSARNDITGPGEGNPPTDWGKVRIYSTAHETDAFGGGYPWMAGDSPTTSYAEWTISDATYPTTPGWSAQAVIAIPRVETVVIPDPLGELPELECWQTHLVLAARQVTSGDYTSRPVIRAVEVIEELRGGTVGSLTGGLD